MIIYKSALFFAKAVSEAVGSENLTAILDGAGELMSFAIALLCIFGVGAVFMLTLIISMGG